MLSWLEERCSVSFWLMDWWMESSNRWLKDADLPATRCSKYTIQVVDNMRLKSFSFCSAHAANTLSLAIFFSLLIRSKLVTWTLLLWSLVNCWTRLYLGVHYPVDILCGLAIGAVVGVSFILSTSGCITASPQKLSIFPTSIRVRVTTMMM
ncbi:MAG: phosphatase PAP2 family protein [Segatella copri]